MAQIVKALFPTNSLQNYVIDCFGPDKSEVRDKFGALAVDVTKSFLLGQVTSPLKAITGSSALRGIKDLAGSTQQIMTTVGQYMDPDQITAMVTKIVENVVNSVVSYIGKDVADGIQTILDFPEISYLGTEAFKRFKDEASTYINDLLKLKSANSQSAGVDINVAIDFSSNRMSGFIQSVSYNVSKFNDKVTEYADIASYWVTLAADYAAMGPDWVETKIQQLLAPKIDQVHQWIQTSVDAIEGIKAEVINAIIDWLARQLYNIFRHLVDKIQEKIQVDADVLKNKANVALEKATVEVKTAIQRETGITIPDINVESIEHIAKSMKKRLDLINMVTKLFSSGGMS